MDITINEKFGVDNEDFRKIAERRGINLDHPDDYNEFLLFFQVGVIAGMQHARSIFSEAKPNEPSRLDSGPDQQS